MNNKPIRWMTILIHYQGDLDKLNKLPKPDEVVKQLKEDFTEITPEGVEVIIEVEDFYDRQ